MDTKARREKLKIEFDRLVSERTRLEELLDQIKGRLYQLQGAYQIIDELEVENANKQPNVVAGGGSSEAEPQDNPGRG